MILRLEVADVASVRFAISPVQELIFSLGAWDPARRQPQLAAWLLAGAPRPDGVDWALLRALFGPRRWMPDYVTPRPETSRPSFAEELARIRSTPAERVRHDLLAAHSVDGAPASLPDVLASLHDNPASVAERIADAIENYWRLVLDPRWPQVHALLEADVTYRCHRIADGGMAALFADLDTRVSWSAGLLSLDYPHLDTDDPVAGRGLALAPSVFLASANMQIDPVLPPFVSYPARGRATLPHTRGPAMGRLHELLGATRAALLLDLAEPVSTTQLASLHALTPGAVSQHLRILYTSELVQRARSGHSVHYRRTPLGDSLVSA